MVIELQARALLTERKRGRWSKTETKVSCVGKIATGTKECYRSKTEKRGGMVKNQVSRTVKVKKR